MLARSGVRTATAALADTALYVQERSRGWTVELLDEPSVISNDFIAGELGIYDTKGRLVRVYPYAELKLINPSPAITIMPNTVFKYHPGSTVCLHVEESLGRPNPRFWWHSSPIEHTHVRTTAYARHDGWHRTGNGLHYICRTNLYRISVA